MLSFWPASTVMSIVTSHEMANVSAFTLALTALMVRLWSKFGAPLVQERQHEAWATLLSIPSDSVTTSLDSVLPRTTFWGKGQTRL